nr:hypothetical protein [Tanacetum cinerariifolium]
MGTLESDRRVLTKLLKCIKEEDAIAEIDWCGYILDCLRNGKVNWKDVKNKNNFYYGPLTFLCLLYLDSNFFLDLNIIRHRPAIRSWNTMMIRKRINMETRQKCLGSLEHHEDFNPEEKQIGIDLYKGLDVYNEPLSDRIPVTREEYYEKIIQKFDKISKERSKLVRTLRDRVTKFENDQMMIKFCKQYRELFNDNEFNVSESYMDDYREGDSDADDNNKKNDDERATMANGNKKNKDGSEAKDNGYEVKDNVNNENDFENLLGDGTKDEVSIDIDIPNEEMKQKEVDKEKVSDKNGNESEKEKQDEVDKVEKENGEYDEEKQFEAFSKTIKSEFKKDHEMKNKKDLEMGNTVIIDNSKTKMTYDAKYNTVCELLKKLFSMHLEKVEHPRAKDVLNKKPTILKPK